MTKLIDRLLHRAEPVAVEKTVAAGPAAVERMVAAPPATSLGVCDICSAPLDPEHSSRVSAVEFTQLVLKGYNPMATGRVSGGLAAAFGLDPEATYPGWREMAISSTTPWALCDDCAKDVNAFRAAH